MNDLYNDLYFGPPTDNPKYGPFVSKHGSCLGSIGIFDTPFSQALKLYCHSSELSVAYYMHHPHLRPLHHVDLQGLDTKPKNQRRHQVYKALSQPTQTAGTST